MKSYITVCLYIDTFIIIEVNWSDLFEEFVHLLLNNIF